MYVFKFNNLNIDHNILKISSKFVNQMLEYRCLKQSYYENVKAIILKVNTCQHQL